MNILKRNGCGLQVKLLLLTVISFNFSQANLQLSYEYLSEIRADEAAEKAAGEYNYDNQGSDWEGTCQDGQMQSPIDLIYNDAVVSSLPGIRFQNYDQSLLTPLLVVNNGHSVNMVLPPTTGGQRALINGGMLPGVFEAQSVHFHWGSVNSLGSEHTINGERYDAEIHIVHKNTKYADKSVGEASMFSDGLAVLGVMIRSVTRRLVRQTGLNSIFNVLPQIIESQSNATITRRLSVSQLLGNIATKEFYTYNGSLTTPDCAESVTWTVFKDVVSIQQSQISKLWNLQDSRRLSLINNYRDLQYINDRPVYYRKL